MYVRVAWCAMLLCLMWCCSVCVGVGGVLLLIGRVCVLVDDGVCVAVGVVRV